MRQKTDDDLFVGVDAGTGSIRAVLFDLQGREQAHHAVPTPVAVVDGGSEHDPHALFEALCTAVGQAVRNIGDRSRIRAIAVAAFGETMIGVDGESRATTPGLAWYDVRPAEAATRIEAAVGRERIAGITGLRAEPTYGLAKIAWMRGQGYDARCWLSVADWLALRLSGNLATDPTMAGRTMAFELAAGCWSETMLQAVGISSREMPPIYPCGTALGPVRPEVADLLGLPRDCIVAVGGYDRVLGTLAVGAGAPGTVLDSLGTAEGLLAFLNPLPNPIVSAAAGFNQGIMPVDAERRAFLFGGLPTCGAAIGWLGHFLGGLDDRALTALAQQAPPHPQGPMFIPTLRLASAPDPECAARGALFGIAPQTGSDAVARAVLEGIAMEAARILQLMRGCADHPSISRILAVGGGARNDFLLRLKATCFGMPIGRPAVAETPALGAAMCAASATGRTGDLASTVQAMGGHPVQEVEPITELIPFYQDRTDKLHRPLTEALVRDLNPRLLAGPEE